MNKRENNAILLALPQKTLNNYKNNKNLFTVKNIRKYK